MELEYIAIHISFERQNEFIDWEKSEFGLVNQKNGFLPNGDWSYIENLRFTNWDEFNRSFQSYLTTEFNVRIKKIVYVNDLPYDLFRLGNPVVKHFCSEKFKSEVEKGELTGFSFEELSS